MNTAARLEQAAPPGQVLLGASTYRLVRDAVVVEPLPALLVKGNAEPLLAYRLLKVLDMAQGRCSSGQLCNVGVDRLRREELLSRSSRYAAAAALTGGSARTVRRRMTDPGFATAVSVRRAERVSEVTGALVSLSARAIRALEECLDAERPSDRIRAAQVVLASVHRYREAAEFEARLNELEGSSVSSAGQAVRAW